MILTVTNENEEWRDIPGMPDYQASSLGRIRSMQRRGNTCYGATRMLRSRILATRASKSGYHRISAGYADTQFVHRLVARAFLPNPNGFPVINHKDGNRGNNRPENLEWCTQKHNMQHAFATGLAPIKRLGKGDASIAAKLSEEKVREIKRRIASGERCTHLAKEYGVVTSTITEIKAGRSWGHVV